MSEIDFAGGKAQSSASPDLQYLSTEALFRLADRCTLGVKNKGDKAWNAISKNQEVLADREFVLNRLSHGIKHLLLLRDKIQAGKPMEGDDDAAAVMWTGMFLCCATKALNSVATEELTQEDGAEGPFSKALFHRLWGRAVGTEHYNKADWLDLQKRLGF